jgi:hypothetical protein
MGIKLKGEGMAATDNQRDEINEIDPAQAFDDLRAEVKVMRRAVEALPGALDETRAPDYTTSLGTMMKKLAVIASQLDDIEKKPALRQTPNAFAESIGRAADLSIQASTRAFATATGRIAEEREQLAQIIGAAHTRQEQRSWLLLIGGLALIIGIVASPFIAMALPFGLDGKVAALIMNRDRWDAGIALLRQSQDQRWNMIVTGTSLLDANHAVVSACQETAAKTKKEQRCTINVSAP